MCLFFHVSGEYNGSALARAAHSGGDDERNGPGKLGPLRRWKRRGHSCPSRCRACRKRRFLPESLQPRAGKAADSTCACPPSIWTCKVVCSALHAPVSMMMDSLRLPQFKGQTASPGCAIRASGAEGKRKASPFTAPRRLLLGWGPGPLKHRIAQVQFPHKTSLVSSEP